MNIWRTDLGEDPTAPENAFDVNLDQITLVKYNSKKGVIQSAEVHLSSGEVVNYHAPSMAQQLYGFMRRPKP